MTVLPGLEDALVGTYRSVAVYSLEKIWALLMADGMDFQEAKEYCSFNIEGAFMGPLSPIFINPVPET